MSAVVVGAREPGEIRADVEWAQRPVPPALRAELDGDRLTTPARDRPARSIARARRGLNAVMPADRARPRRVRRARAARARAWPQRLVDCGVPTTLWARRAESLAPFAGRVEVAPDLPALGRASDVVGICVTDGAAVRAVVLGPDGVLAGMARRAACSPSTPRSGPTSARELAAAGAERGVARDRRAGERRGCGGGRRRAHRVRRWRRRGGGPGPAGARPLRRDGAAHGPARQRAAHEAHEQRARRRALRAGARRDGDRRRARARRRPAGRGAAVGERPQLLARGVRRARLVRRDRRSRRADHGEGRRAVRDRRPRPSPTVRRCSTPPTGSSRWSAIPGRTAPDPRRARHDRRRAGATERRHAHPVGRRAGAGRPGLVLGRRLVRRARPRTAPAPPRTPTGSRSRRSRSTVDGVVRTLRRGADGIEVVPGDHAELRVAMDRDAFADLVVRGAHRARTGDRRAGRGRRPRRAGRSAAGTRCCARCSTAGRCTGPATSTLRGRDGGPLDLDQSFRLGERPDEAAHFLAEAGFLLLTDVFTDAEMDAVDADLAARRRRRRSRTTARRGGPRPPTGERYPCRILDFARRSPALRGRCSTTRASSRSARSSATATRPATRSASTSVR